LSDSGSGTVLDEDKSQRSLWCQMGERVERTRTSTEIARARQIQRDELDHSGDAAWNWKTGTGQALGDRREHGQGASTSSSTCRGETRRIVLGLHRGPIKYKTQSIKSSFFLPPLFFFSAVTSVLTAGTATRAKLTIRCIPIPPPTLRPAPPPSTISLRLHSTEKSIYQYTMPTVRGFARVISFSQEPYGAKGALEYTIVD
jgi:hypothetical protein